MATPSDAQSAELVTLGNGDVSLVVLNKVYDAPEAEISEQMRDAIARQQINKHYEGFIKALQDNAEVNTAFVTAEEPNL